MEKIDFTDVFAYDYGKSQKMEMWLNLNKKKARTNMMETVIERQTKDDRYL